MYRYIVSNTKNFNIEKEKVIDFLLDSGFEHWDTYYFGPLYGIEYTSSKGSCSLMVCISEDEKQVFMCSYKCRENDVNDIHDVEIESEAEYLYTLEEVQDFVNKHLNEITSCKTLKGFTADFVNL